GQNFYVILAPTAALFGIEGGDGSFEIQSNTDWTIETDVSWIQVLDTLTGNGNLFKDYSVEANDTEFSRVGRITVNDAYLDIVQGGGGDKPIAPSETVAPWEGGESFTHELTVLGNPAIAVDEDWVEVTSFVSVDGEATLTFDVDENPAMEERLAIITIGSEMHAVRQLAKPLVAPVLSSFSVAGGALLTRDPVVKLTPVLSEGTMEEYRASESISFNDTDWGPIGNGAKIVLSDGWEEKRVYFQARNSMGESGILSDTIFLLPPPPRLVGAFYSDVDGFSATLICEPGHVYRILWSEDMSNWNTLEELTAETAEVPVVDADAAGGNLRFYRVVCDDEL
ncbi:MAG: BACON domain-containing carbohydrate-binding protein, partial [Verrucomicrobiota bacterium]